MMSVFQRCCGLCAVMLGSITGLGLSATAASEIEVSGCFLMLKEQAQIPAREAGIIQTIVVQPGDTVTASQTLAVLDDEEARLTLQQAELDLAVMQKKETDAVLVEIAAAAAQESTQLLRQAELTEQISRKTADTDVPIRQAVAAVKVAQDAFDRATESRKAFRTSVSDQELVRLNYELQKNRLDEEQARLNRELERLQADSQSAVVSQRQTGSSRLLLQKTQTQLEQELVGLQVRQMRTAVALAKEKLDRRKMKSPLSGVVVEKLRYPGEWVMAGDPVLRVIYLEELYVEGYADAESVDASFQGRSVRVQGTTRGGSVTVAGRLVFVSPETDGVNRQVQVRAAIPNTDLRMRPGQRVQMVITAD